HDSFCFGTFGASASAEVWYDWISFTNQGMYAPGEEVDCIGSLIPEFFTCSTPFADVDDTNGDGEPEGDGDVDQDDFAEFQACYTGDGIFALSDLCDCFDRDNDDDVDTADYGEFQKCASGPNIPVAGDPDCDFN
ncbi:MAG: hypothetical protein ACYTA5_21580, partial [Planctomycetota bacterium]